MSESRKINKGKLNNNKKYILKIKIKHKKNIEVEEKCGTRLRISRYSFSRKLNKLLLDERSI